MTAPLGLALVPRAAGARAGRYARRVVAGGLLLLCGLLSAGSSLAATEAGDAPEAMKMPHPGMRMAPTTPMEKEMHALQAELARLKPQMERIAATGDAAEKRRLTAEHLASLRSTLARFHAMEVQMVDWVTQGRSVSDTDLRVRQQMLADQSAMLVQMLEQTMQAAGGLCP